MVTAHQDDGGLRIDAASYRLWFRPDRPYAVLDDADGERLAELCTVASLHTTDGLDDTTAVEPPRVDVPDGGGGDPVVVTVAMSSSRWPARRTVFRCADDHLAVRAEVDGHGALTDVHLLGGYVSAFRRWSTGFHASGSTFRSLVVPDPSDPERDVVPAWQPGTIDVLGSSLPGRGRWFFTPGPLCFLLSRSAVDAAAAPAMGAMPAGPWTSIGLGAAIDELTFTGMHLEPGDRSFSVRLAYEGQTGVDGTWASPWLVVRSGASDPYAELAAHRALLDRLGVTPAVRRDPQPWWSEPIFCGWGAQCHLSAVTAGTTPMDFARQDVYDRLLDELAARDVVPGTVVIDDRWERIYGTGEADPERWPDLRGWIDRRHAAGQRVLLWWKAWDPSALEPELCVRNAAGLPIGADPSHPGYRQRLTDVIGRMLDTDGYGADGLKIDFTALTPSGPAMVRHGDAWGIRLLHELLATIREAAKAVRPDALLITHTPDPRFEDVTDMIRLNDVQRLDDPQPGAPFVEHMTHRARLVRAAMPGVPIDTDDWALPDRRTWRAYLERKASLGVPSLYYVTHIDRSGEALTDDDYAAIRRVWGAHRRSAGIEGRMPSGRETR